MPYEKSPYEFRIKEDMPPGDSPGEKTVVGGVNPISKGIVMSALLDESNGAVTSYNNFIRNATLGIIAQALFLVSI